MLMAAALAQAEAPKAEAPKAGTDAKVKAEYATALEHFYGATQNMAFCAQCHTTGAEWLATKGGNPPSQCQFSNAYFNSKNLAATSGNFNQAVQLWAYTAANVEQKATEALGLAVRPADEPLRRHLGIEADHGLLVTKVVPDSPAAKAKLKEHDLVLKLDGKWVTKADDLAPPKENADATVTLEVVRDGKPGVYKVVPKVNWRSATAKPRYLVGIGLGPVDETLRKHLSLPKGQGVIVTTIEEGSAAVGKLEQHDILLQYDGTAIASQEELTKMVQAGEGKQIAFSLVRAGKPMVVMVKPSAKQDPNVALWHAYRNVEVLPTHTIRYAPYKVTADWAGAPSAAPSDAAKELEAALVKTKEAEAALLRGLKYLRESQKESAKPPAAGATKEAPKK
ncbi:MAG TPA: PDZ domain-containing protein [Planctomycetia bacterium]|nr:PDZ domain-containing protein [Planctomycetia bacterium]